MARQKSEIVSFKAESALLDALRGLPNRSEFIRAALLAALDGACPLCKGTGILSPAQRTHWELFARDHQVRECADCHELHLVCDRGAGGGDGRDGGRGGDRAGGADAGRAGGRASRRGGGHGRRPR